MSIWATWNNQDGRFFFSTTDNGGVRITNKYHVELLDAAGAGKVIVSDSSGRPQIADPLPQSVESLQASERAWRDSLLDSAVWLRDRHRDQLEIGSETTLIADQFQGLLVYMQALRDWPQSPDFPDREHRPVAPDWIAAQIE
jgi:hypothetical protein